MATAPQITLRSGTGYTTNLVFTTNEEAVFVSGTVDNSTAAIQVSVNGGAFVTDPTLILLTLNNFIIPNPSNYPSGLMLDLGENVIKVRTIDIVGGVSPISTVTVTRVVDIVNLLTSIPTGIQVQRNLNTVTIQAAIPVVPTNQGPAPQFIGFNFYASTAAGGTTGYFIINQTPVTTASTTTGENVFATQTFGTTWSGPGETTKYVRVRISTEDQFNNELSVQMDQLLPTTGLFDTWRVNGSFQDFALTSYASFTHDRTGTLAGTLNSDQWSGVANTDPLYYVVTAIYFDPTTNSEIETPYSQEVLGTPLVIDTNIRDLPTRTQLQITLDYITAIQRVNTEVAMVPGSTTRDVSIDPFASESERLWFLMDFVHRSQSFLTLLQIDDPGNTGTSVSVASSAYKTALQAALGYTSTSAVQALIDTQFAKLAANVNKFRLPGQPSVGQVVVYTTSAPTQNITIPSRTVVSTNGDPTTNIASQSFVIGGFYVLPATNALAYYNFDTKQYEVTVDITAQSIGSAGNVSSGTIVNIAGVSGVQVINRNATVFGTDIETNDQLATRGMLGFVSVDTGTEGGYAETAASQIGITKAEIIKSGDALMMRDYDPLRMKHIGGKVDIWIQGIQEATVQDTFAFTIGIGSAVRVQVLDPTNLIFEVLDSRVTATSPLIEILNNPLLNLGVYNATAAESYDLTGLVILNYNIFQINATLTDQPTTHLDDVIYADYRFRINNEFLFTNQPVRRVISVVGEISGALDPAHGYALYKTDDPLLNGESTIAKNYLQVVQYNGIPSGNTIAINAELHVLIGFQNEPLDSIGINTATIAVYSEDRLTEYSGPTSDIPDYEILEGTTTSPAAIVRTSTTTIPNGATVSVDYSHDENFVVTYVINELLTQFQTVLNSMKHATADVLAKQAVQNFVTIETTVQLADGATKNNVDPKIRTAVSLALDTKTIGQGIAQSNVDSAINDTTGVQFNVLPMALMAYADGSLKLRESVASDYEPLASLAIGGNVVFILTQELENPTTDGGGYVTEHHGVFQDDQQLTNATSLLTVGQNAGQGWVIGSDGAIIQGYSDDATLAAEGFLPDQIPAQRLLLTANHALVSILGSGTTPDNPENHVYTISYVVRGATGSQDITVSSMEYTDLGNLVLTYRNYTGT
jgi:hypothetical protein